MLIIYKLYFTFRYNLYLKLFLVMGINWVMEIISWIFEELKGLWYMTDIMNSLQVRLFYISVRSILRILKNLKFLLIWLFIQKHASVFGGSLFFLKTNYKFFYISFLRRKHKSSVKIQFFFFNYNNNSNFESITINFFISYILPKKLTLFMSCISLTFYFSGCSYICHLRSNTDYKKKNFTKIFGVYIQNK